MILDRILNVIKEDKEDFNTLIFYSLNLYKNLKDGDKNYEDIEVIFCYMVETLILKIDFKTNESSLLTMDILIKNTDFILHFIKNQNKQLNK